MSQEEILKLIGNISPQARDYVHNSFENVEVIYSMVTEQNKGIFIKVDSKDLCIFYASFLNESKIEDILEIIKTSISGYISKANKKDVCFNVYGNNPKIISLVRKSGFKRDIEGYYLEYVRKELPQLKNSNLMDKGFESIMLKGFVELFDSAYYQLCKDNGWEIDSCAKEEDQFHERLSNSNKSNDVCSFWINNELVGAYIIKENYIMDIVVNPIYQNKGYGSYILAHCINNMRVNKHIDNIRLGVAKTNIGAKRLYERNGFVEISSYAEHTYK